MTFVTEPTTPYSPYRETEFQLLSADKAREENDIMTTELTKSGKKVNFNVNFEFQ